MDRLLKERGLAAGLFLALLVQLVYGMRTDGMTDDEPVYIGAGYRHLHGDFSINPEQPPVAKLLAAAPLLTLDLVRPPHGKGEDQCGWAYRFIHEANRHAPILQRARIPAVALTMVVALLIWRWAAVLGGPWAGLLALALAAFQPALLAHGHLAATDLPGAAAMFAASFLFWRFLIAPSLARAVLVAVVASLAVLSRLTAAVLAPSFALIVIVEILRAREARGRPARAAAMLSGVTLVVGPMVAWAVYGFRFPHELVEAVRFQMEHNARGHAAYLLGDPGRAGWPYYYLVAFVGKNTPGFLALVALALWRVRRAAPLPWWHWLVPAVALFAGASAGRIQIGERYILAVYPYLIVWIAVLCAPLVATARGRLVLGALLLAHVIPVVRVAPRGYLTYFNALAGGPRGGHRWLADSNLDWGQDLPRLADWMRRHGVTRVQLGYFGSDDPDRYGIAHEDLPTWHSHHPIHPPSAPFSGTVVVSPNLLLGFLVPRHQNPYELLLERPPDDRAGIFFVYRLTGAP